MGRVASNTHQSNSSFIVESKEAGVAPSSWVLSRRTSRISWQASSIHGDPLPRVTSGRQSLATKLTMSIYSPVCSHVPPDGSSREACSMKKSWISGGKSSAMDLQPVDGEDPPDEHA